MGKTRDIGAIVRSVFPEIAIREYLSRNGKEPLVARDKQPKMDNGRFYRPKIVYRC